MRKYLLDADNKPVNFTDYTYYEYDPIHLANDGDFLNVIDTWTKKYYFLANYWNTVKV